MYCSHCKRELALRTFSKNKVGKRLKNCKRCNKHRREITKKWKEPFRQNIKCFKCKKEIWFGVLYKTSTGANTHICIECSWFWNGVSTIQNRINFVL